MLAKVLVVLVFLAIVASLGSGLFFMIRDKGETDRVVKALTVRVAISIGLFFALFVLWWLGIIQPHSIT